MSPCVVWPGAKTGAGYGEITVGGRVYLVHRAAYEIEIGPIPDGLTIDHLCRNRACWNVAHMEVVTRAENGRRGATKEVCKRGHVMAESAVPDGARRTCKPCRDLRNAARYAA